MLRATAEGFQDAVSGTTDFTNNELVLDIESRSWSDYQSAAEEVAQLVASSGAGDVLHKPYRHERCSRWSPRNSRRDPARHRLAGEQILERTSRGSAITLRALARNPQTSRKRGACQSTTW